MLFLFKCKSNKKVVLFILVKIEQSRGTLKDNEMEYAISASDSTP